MVVDAGLLLRDYNTYRFQTDHIATLRAKGRYPRSLKDNKTNLSAFEKLARWCSRRNIDARHWLYTLFVIRYWKYPPKLNQLCSERHLQRYENMGDGGYRQLVDQENINQPAFDANRDLSRASELLKLRFSRLGQPGRCMERTFIDTYGYHPKSEYCVRCPFGAACEAQLRNSVGYDITALRRGELTRDQAMVLASVRR